MKKLFSTTLAALAVTLIGAAASAQVVTGPVITSYRPIVGQAPTVTYSPVINSVPTATVAPVVAYSPVVAPAATGYVQPYTVARPITTYSPVVVPMVAGYAQPYTVARPIALPVTTYSPVVVAPVMTYRPVYSAPAPVVAYRYPTRPYVNPLATVPTYGSAVYTRPVITTARPIMYYPGQPIRNTFRAITP